MRHKIEGGKAVFSDIQAEKQEARRAKLTALADKKAQGKLTLEDLNAKLDIIIEMLTEAAK